jgi:hypothetical protein
MTGTMKLPDYLATSTRRAQQGERNKAIGSHMQPNAFRIPVERLAVLATPAEGPLTEAICAENPTSFFASQPAMPVPQAVVPDF